MQQSFFDLDIKARKAHLWLQSNLFTHHKIWIVIKGALFWEKVLEWMLFIIPSNEVHTYSRDRHTDALNDNIFMKPSYYILSTFEHYWSIRWLKNPHYLWQIESIWPVKSADLTFYRLCELQSLNTAKVKKKELETRWKNTVHSPICKKRQLFVMKHYDF